jgi:hypothetical protein
VYPVVKFHLLDQKSVNDVDRKGREKLGASWRPRNSAQRVSVASNMSPRKR